MNQVAAYLATIAWIAAVPVMILLFVGYRKEFVWIGRIAATMLSFSQPPLFWISALMAGSVLALRGWQMRKPGILTCRF